MRASVAWCNLLHTMPVKSVLVSVCTCVCICLRVPCVYVCMWGCAPMCLLKYTRVHTCVSVLAPEFVCARTCRHVRLSVRTRAGLRVSVCELSVFVCVGRAASSPLGGGLALRTFPSRPHPGAPTRTPPAFWGATPVTLGSRPGSLGCPGPRRLLGAPNPMTSLFSLLVSRERWCLV